MKASYAPHEYASLRMHGCMKRDNRVKPKESYDP